MEIYLSDALCALLEFFISDIETAVANDDDEWPPPVAKNENKWMGQRDSDAIYTVRPTK